MYLDVNIWAMTLVLVSFLTILGSFHWHYLLLIVLIKVVAITFA